MSLGVVERVRLTPSKITQPIQIELLEGDNVVANSVLKGETISIHRRGLDVELIIFNMLNFDIILSMDS